MLQFCWVIFQYLATGVMIVGTIYRYTYNQYDWGSKSSEILEKQLLRWGRLLFHWGIVFVFIGHVIGLLIPLALYRWLGIFSEFYHLNAEIFGGVAGVVVWLGILLLLIRRIFNTAGADELFCFRLRGTCRTVPDDSIALYVTMISNTFHGAYVTRAPILYRARSSHHDKKKAAKGDIVNRYL